MFQKNSGSAAGAALASMETLEDKLDTPNDGMENVKLDVTVSTFYIFYVYFKHPCASFPFLKSVKLIA